MQLRPFAPILFGEYADYYFQKLEDEETKLIDDDDYAPYKSEGAKLVENRSPEPAEELKKMSDEQLLAFLNDWDNAHDDPEKWWVHITFEGLAQEFRSIFKEVILADEARIRFWIANRGRIKRPIYVQAIMSALHEHIKLKQFDMLDLWFEFCKWVLSHPDRLKEKGINRSDQSGEHPDWQSSRREVGDFVETCLREDINAPIQAKDSLVSLLDRLCSQYDRQLDEEEPVLLSGNDQLTEAINNTRSRALKSLVDFGYWVRRQSGNNQADTPEVFDILDKRLDPECDHLLTLPEYAILGSCYGYIWGLNQEWATQHKSDLFPQGKLQAWTEAFGNFLRYSQPYKPIFDIVQTDIKFALENIDEFNTDSYGRTNLISELGKHLFTYYLWKVYPLTGSDSLLERFYEKTQVARWSHLFGYVGRSLENSGELLQEGLEEKIKEFFDWRLEQKEPSELKEFAVWLETRCLAAEWRLKSYSKVLDVLLCGSGDIETYHGVDTLYRMLDENTALVTECFAKLTGLIAKNEGTGYIDVDQARSIIQAGLSNNDDTVKSNAEQAQENLLRCGHSSLLD